MDTQYLNFGSLPIGTSSLEVINVTNTLATRGALLIRGDTAPHSRDFSVFADKLTLPPGGVAALRFAAHPRRRGERRHTVRVAITGRGQVVDYEIALSAHGETPERLSLIELSPPRGSPGKVGRHFFLSITNPAYVRALQLAEDPFYVAIGTGTRGGVVTPLAQLAPGEVLVDPANTKLDKFAVATCFDWQEVSGEWLNQHVTALSESSIVSDINHALSHVLGPCSGQLCRHEPSPTRRSAHLPRRGDIVELRTRGPRVWAVVVSSAQVTSFLTGTIGRGECPLGIVVVGLEARPNDTSSFWGVRSNGQPDLILHCYRPKLADLGAVQPTGRSVSPEDMCAIEARVLTAIGGDS